MQKSGSSACPDKVCLHASLLGFLGVILWCVSIFVLWRYLSLPMVVHSDFVNFYYAEAAYPPLVRLIFLPLTLLPIYPAYLLWSFLTILSYLLLLYWMFHALDLSLPISWLLLVTGLLISWYPFWGHVALGQVSIFLSLCMVGGWLCLLQDREVACGALWGLACALKLFPGLLLIYLVLRKRWKAAGAMIATTILGLLLPLLVLSDLSFAYLLEIISENAALYVLFPINVSLNGVFSRLFLNNPWIEPIAHAPIMAWSLRALTSAGVCGVLGWQLWRLPRTHREDSFAFAYTCIAMILLSPISWQHIFPLLLLAFGLLLRVLLDHPTLNLGRSMLFAWVCFSLPDIEIARALIQIYAPYQPPWWIALPLLLPTLGMIYLWGLLEQLRQQTI